MTASADTRRLVRLIRVLLLFESSMYSALSPLLPHYEHTLHVSKSQIGLLGASYSAGLIPGSLLGGWIATRIGVRRTTFAGLVGFGITSAAYGLVDPLWALDALRAAQGVFCGLIWGGALTWVIAATPRERRGETIGQAVGAATIGTLVGPVLGTIAAAVGTAPVFIAVGVVAIVLAQRTHRLPDPDLVDVRRAADAGTEAAPAGAVAAAPGGRVARTLHLIRALGLGAWLIALASMVFGAAGVLLPLRLSHLGAGGAEIGAAFIVASAIEATLSPRIGRIVDRRGPYLTVAAGLVVAAPLLAALVLPQTAIALAIVAVVALGIPFCALLVPAPSMLSAVTERHGVPLVVATSLMNLAYALGEVIGAPAGAAISQAAGNTLPFLILAGITLATLVPVLVARARARRPGGRDATPDQSPIGSSVTSRATSAA
jgi:MFS family permease